MSTVDLSSVITLADFGKEVETATGNVKNWVDKAEVKPAAKFGNTNVYARADLVKAMEEHSTQASGFRKLGYVHPEEHRKIQDMHASAVLEAIAHSEALKGMEVSYAALQLENAQLTERYNRLHATFDDLVATQSE